MRLFEHVTAAAVSSLAVLGLVGCGGDQVATFEPITDPAQLYTRLVINHRAVNMSVAAPHNTLQLVATPLDANGLPMTGLSAPTFTTSDSTSVFVSPDGLLTARQAADGIRIIADLQAAGNLRHADTIFVRVTDDPPPSQLTTFSVQSVGADSAILSEPLGLDPDIQSYVNFFGGYFQVLFTFHLSGVANLLTPGMPMPSRTQALDADGNSMDLNIRYEVLDPRTVQLDDDTHTRVLAKRPGQGRVVASTTAYGVVKTDTLTITVRPALFAIVPIEPRQSTGALFGPTRRIRSNSFVVWVNGLDRPVDIVYDNPALVVSPPTALCDVAATSWGWPGTHCGAGNITVPARTDATVTGGYQVSQFQKFTEPGVYDFHDALTGATGRFVVDDGEEAP